MTRILFSLMLLPMFTFAQVIDDFSDGDFTANLVWSGEDSKFMVNTSNQLQLNGLSATDTAYLSTSNSSIDSTEWQFYVKMQFDPSNNNYLKVYLVSDQANLEGPLNGYFLRLGENLSNDDIDLYRQDGTTETLVVDGIDGNVASSPELRIKVTRDNLGNWNLYSDLTGGTNFSLEGTGTDNTYTTTGFFGLFCRHTTSNSTKYYFDDFYIGPFIFDTLAPIISSVTVTSNTTIDVFFSEYVALNGSQVVGNYSANNGIGNPNTAVRDGVDSTMVHLTFTTQFENGIINTLTVINVADILSNSIVTPVMATFLYLVPDTAERYDIVINELLPDPSPPVGLPEAEFIELYNNSNKIIDLANFTISDGGTPAVLASKILFPGSYVILCTNPDTADYGAFGEVMGISMPALNNAGDNMELRDANGVLIHRVDYTDAWYADGSKEGDGWTLEMIDPSNPCGGGNNWRRSVSVTGGTPGQKNSVFGSNPDNVAPTLLRADVLDSLNVILTFNEALDDTGVFTATYILSDNLVLVSATLGTTQIVLTLSTALVQDVVYTISINYLKDCVGNSIGNPNSAQFAMPQQAQAGDLIINEILFNPRANYYNDGSDFVEIYNNSQRYIDLRDWQLANFDNNTIDNLKSITAMPYVVFPGDYVVLTRDTANIKDEYPEAVELTFLQMESLPGYNNGDGTVILIDNLLQVSDSITYNEDMHFVLLNDINGVSLERLDFDRPSNDITNWHSASEAVGYATPGYLNSQYNPTGESTGAVTIDPELFSPDNDGIKDVVNIYYEFDAAGFVGTITIYDAKGRLIKSLIQNELLGTSGTYSWDGITEEFERARVGIYIIYFEVFGLSGEIKQFKKTCVLAAKL